MSDEFPTTSELAKVVAGEDRDLAYVQALMPLIGDFVRLAQLATNGKVEDVPALVERPRDFYSNLIGKNRSALLGYLMVRSLHEAMNRPSKKDPLEHAKFLLDLVKHHDVIEKLGKHGGEIPGTADEAQSATDELLRELEGRSDSAGS